MPNQKTADFVVLISAGAEFRSLLPLFPQVDLTSSPYHEFFHTQIDNNQVVFLHTGWGKVATAGATQYAIDRWHPKLLINLGTCGGFKGRVKKDEIILAEETIIYDIIEQMTDADQAVRFYSSKAELTWLGQDFPISVRRAKLLSADRDILPQDIPILISRFDAIAADWESGAFAWTASQNKTDWLILRGVSDIVDRTGSEAYGNVSLWMERSKTIMAKLLDCLPFCLQRYQSTHL